MCVLYLPTGKGLDFSYTAPCSYSSIEGIWGGGRERRGEREGGWGRGPKIGTRIYFLSNNIQDMKRTAGASGGFAILKDE